MATVKFDNPSGEPIRVNFDTQPTMQDIEEVERRLIDAGRLPGSQKQPTEPSQPEEPKKGFLRRATEAVFKPTAELAARPVQLARSVGERLGTASVARGAVDARTEQFKQEAAQRQVAGDARFAPTQATADIIRQEAAERAPEELAVNIPFFGRTEAPQTRQDIMRDVGRGAQTVALGVGGGAAAGAGRGALSGAVGQAARAGAVGGAKAGALAGAGQQLETTGQVSAGTAGSALLGAGIGGVGGGVLGGGLGLAGRGIRGAGRQAAAAIPEERLPQQGLLRRARQAALAPTDETTAKVADAIGPDTRLKRNFQQAFEEGRVQRASQTRVGRALFGRKPDIIAQSEQINKAAQTIQKRIPLADRLDDANLSSRIKGEITNISKQLEGDLKQVPASKDLAKNANSAWTRLKRRQLQDADIQSFPGAKTAQRNFENFLKKVSKANNLDDLWKVRQEYDDIIKANVKKATDSSDLSQRVQKEMWLDNRAILNDLINTNAKQIKNTNSRQAFSELSDLYAARQNIVSKVRPGKIKPGVVNASNIAKLGLLFVGGNIIEQQTGINIPFI